ncbi:HTTM domain-containing protein [Flavihumibacter petaseus]|uniref:Gamma-glutamyl carboxylase homolog n=1 Tax=Flavihumibacter petaseus NBRC 106054 TaxID=1220578 RepID=A0A0E9N4X7_9BACT|nr:HTTM domain-containing protein [Flavihumibacter petaseus]GAO44864.1 gamma-glutamyl carboxylase homolog [Flavihumibacter petaseus NBRC 106054]
MTGTKRYDLFRPVPIAPLVVFRISFGLLMFFSLLRFWWRGWVTAVYVQPKFHFSYFGWEWVQAPGNTAIHVLFGCITLAALFIAFGFLYRIAIVVFFLGFTYIELIDVTTYLNHYYFISLVAFILIWLPANRDWSMDVSIRPQLRCAEVPAWTIGILRFQMAIVYIFAGLAKLNADWLLQAEPMRTWLPAKSHLPIVGPLMYKAWVAYVFSWFGAIYDLFIVFFLLNDRTRKIAYLFVLAFHIATAIFFPGIGMFPYVMIVSSLIFFPSAFHEKLLSRLGWKPAPSLGYNTYNYTRPKRWVVALLVYAAFQVLFPLRFLMYPDKLFWNEEGYRFSWRVMLMEKAGTAYFTVKDGTTGAAFVVDNKAFLTPLQEKMMSTQPDMILQYAHHLAAVYKQKGIQQPRVFGEVYVALNGRRSALFIDPAVDLAAQQRQWTHYNWILPCPKTKE